MDPLENVKQQWAADCIIDDEINFHGVVTVFANDYCEGIGLMRIRESSN